MRRSLFLALLLAIVLGGIAAAGNAKQAKTKQETKLLEGTWKITAAEVGGKKVEFAKLGADQVVFAGDRVILKHQGKDVGAYAYTVDATKKPRQMNWLDARDRLAAPLIYEINEDELRLCRPLVSSTKRPETFETNGMPVMLLTAKRERK